jgi:Domain of unknown function (DUF4180)
MHMRPDGTDKTIAIPRRATENLPGAAAGVGPKGRDMEQESTHTDVATGSDDVVPIGGVPVLRCVADGPVLDGEQAALDLIGATMGRTDVLAVPVARVPPAFFDLSSGVAGAIVQKFANYRVRLVVVGDVTDRVAASTALRDFVRECNRGRQTWFVADEAELAARLH